MSNYRGRRASPGCTYDPCPGCGSDEYMRPKGRVCDSCNTILIKHRALEADKESKAAQQKDVYYVPAYAGDMPYVPYEVRDPKNFGRSPLREALLTLAHLVSAPVDDSVDFDKERVSIFPEQGKGYSRYLRTNLRRMSAVMAEVLTAVWTNTHASLQNAYREGHKDGRNLLNQLASGQTTADEFNNVVLRRES